MALRENRKKILHKLLPYNVNGSRVDLFVSNKYNLCSIMRARCTSLSVINESNETTINVDKYTHNEGIYIRPTHNHKLMTIKIKIYISSQVPVKLTGRQSVTGQI